MATVYFTENLRKHLNCSTLELSGKNLKGVMQQLKKLDPKLAGYILDDQERIRKHILVSIDSQFIRDKVHLSDSVKDNSEIYIMQALSGG